MGVDFWLIVIFFLGVKGFWVNEIVDLVCLEVIVGGWEFVYLYLDGSFYVLLLFECVRVVVKVGWVVMYLWVECWLGWEGFVLIFML